MDFRDRSPDDTDDVAIGEFPDARWTAVASKVE